jgi:hypothetical protein
VGVGLRGARLLLALVSVLIFFPKKKAPLDWQIKCCNLVSYKENSAWLADFIFVPLRRNKYVVIK